MNKSTGTEQKKKRRGRLLTWALILVGIGAVAAYVIANRPEVVVDFTTERIEIGSLFQEVSATGTINPIEVVDVGTQVSGIIDEVFTDHNAKVKKGQVIARMDMRNLQATVRESRANITKAEVALTQAQLNFDRSVRLLAGGAVTHADLERDEVELENAKANLDLMRLQADKASINLSYATIISPIDGIVISKNVDVGQTVAASFATPTLFRIANDLTKMKIEASVDEADIGQVRIGQNVEFTVDTYTHETFAGVVDQIQLQPIEVQNVVTYKVIILIENAELKLLPGMTATLVIKTVENPPALTIANTAIDLAIAAEDARLLKQEGYTIKALAQKKGRSIWLKDGQSLEEVPVRPGFDNGFRSAIDAPDLEGREIILRIAIDILDGSEDNTSIFSPRYPEAMWATETLPFTKIKAGM